MANEQPEKMNGASLDIAAEQRARLKELFPAVFTETVSETGELVESVDFAKLQAELGAFADVFENRRERYGMDWPGKKDALRLVQTPSHATLKPCREESVNFDTTEHLFIEGDNLEVLKLLQKSYYGKIKMIYIDPPYNTGKEFIYPDNYTEDLQTYLEYAGLADSSGKKFSTNTANEGRFHTKWLNMMYPRLYLARNLLRDDGVIFISIDDNEVTNLRKLCDEVFGEENFVDTIIWKKRYGGGAKERYLVSVHEYILFYAKNKENLNEIFIPTSKDTIRRYYTEKDTNFELRGPYRTHPLEATKSMGERKNLVFPIEAPDGRQVLPKRQWLWSKERVAESLSNGELAFIKDKDGGWSVHTKQYLKDENGEVRGSKAFSLIDNIFTQHGTNEIIDLFGDAQAFSFPKPSTLLQQLIPIGASSDDIILDFFAGSATTAHAVLDLNKQDGGQRKFILVQLPEPCGEDTEAFKAGYRTIADIGKERIRRVINKLNAEQQGKLDLEGDADQDRGFRVLKLDQSNFKPWRPLAASASVADIEQQLFAHVDHLEADATPEDLLFEILLKAGFAPTAQAEQRMLAGIPVFSVAEGALLICLAEGVSKELIDAVVAENPQQFICLDAAFGGNDQLKSNAVQTFKAHNLQKEKHNQIVFKTV